MTSSDMQLDIRTANEAGLLWPDEGRHVVMLENMQVGTFQLVQRSYTALHINLSYLFSWILNSGESPIPSKVFVQGSKWVSWVSMSAFLIIVMFWMTSTLSSPYWGIFTLLILIFQRFSIVYSTRLHPESTMILFIALTLWMATLSLYKGRVVFLWAMVSFSGFAIGAKPLCLFLLPWMGVIFLLTFLKYGLFTIKNIFVWGGGACLFFLASFFLATPYQVLNIKVWSEGLLAEKQTAAHLEPNDSLWNWSETILSDAYLGPIFVVLFIIALFICIKHTIRVWKKDGFSSFDLPTLCFVINFSWIVIGAGYIILTSHSFIERYLIHVHLSFLIVTILGMYWGMNHLTLHQRKWVIPLVLLLLWGGLQIQWRRAMRAIDERKITAQQLPIHRDFFEKIKQVIPINASILYSKDVYLGEKYFPRAHQSLNKKDIIGQNIDKNWIKKHKFKFLIFRSEVYGEALLKEAQMSEDLKFVLHEPNINISVYQRKITSRL